MKPFHAYQGTNAPPVPIELPPVSEMSTHDLQMELRYRRGECRRYQIQYKALYGGEPTDLILNGYVFETPLIDVLESFVRGYGEGLFSASIQETTEQQLINPAILSSDAICWQPYEYPHASTIRVGAALVAQFGHPATNIYQDEPTP